MTTTSKIGLGSIADGIPDGLTGPTDSITNTPTHPRLTADFVGPPPSSSVFTSIAFGQYGPFSGVMHVDPLAFQTQAHGLDLGYTATPRVSATGYSYDYHKDLTLGLAGLDVSGTALAAASDWTATADWGGQMRATMGQGMPFTYVTRQPGTAADVVIALDQQTGPSRDVPLNPLTYRLSGLSGTFDGGATTFRFAVDAGSSVAQGIQARVSYDFDGDGKVDRVETYDWFATDASDGDESYTGARLVSATGAMRDLRNGSVSVELWHANGDDAVRVRTGSADSAVTLPYAGLIAGGTASDGTLYLQGGAQAGGDPGALATAVIPGAAPAYDTTQVPPGLSVGGYAGPGRVWYNQGGVVGVTINGTSYGIFGPTGATWTYTDAGLRSDLGGKDYYSVAVLPDASLATLMAFRQHAYAFVTDTRSSFTVDAAAGTVTTTFAATTVMKEQGADLSSDPLMALYRHQYIDSTDPLSGVSYASPRGEIRLLAGGSSFTTTTATQPMLPIMPFVGTDAQKQLITLMLHDELKAFLSAQNDPLEGDTYWGARQNAKFGDLALLAQQVGYGQARDVFVGAIEKQLERWFTADDGDKFLFAYDKEWATLIGYPADFDSDDKLNDHHFHYGYIINAAATVAQLDPGWAAQSRWGAMVNELVADVANDDRSNTDFTFLRTFDPYAGHSWASGTGIGQNQESASEAIEFASATARWGAASGQKDIQDLGTYLHATEVLAFQQYWQDVDHAVFPDGVQRAIMGIVGDNGASYTNFFDGDPAHIEGIQYTPINGGSLFMAANPQEITEELAELRALERSDRSTEWMNGTQMVQALADPEAALADYLANPQYSSGGGEESRAYTLEWIQSLVTLGTPDLSIKADSTFAIAYTKDGARSYTAWNPATTAATVHFSDGISLDVAAGSMVTRLADGTLRSVTFGADIPFRPDGVPLDLPTDPPAYALTTIATNGDLVLSVEATTGTAWITVGTAAPRALLNGTGHQSVDFGGASRLLGIGRDAAGGIVLLAGVNGGEPYYPFQVTDRMQLGGNGAALYKSDWQVLEPQFGTDINGDGIVLRGTLTLVAQNGALKLFTDTGTGTAYVQDGTAAMHAVFRDRGDTPTALTRNGWSLSAIGRDPDGNLRVLDTMEHAGISYAWKLDAAGHWIGETTYGLGNVSAGEALFQKDLNGDGVIPAAPPQLVVRNGELQLLVDPGTGDAIVQLEDGTRQTITRGGPNDAVKLDRGSRLFEIGRDEAGRLRVLDGNPDDRSVTSQHWSWILDGTGHWVGEDVIQGTGLPAIEPMYGTDLDGDGKIGILPYMLVERHGSDALYVDKSTGIAFVSVAGAAPIAVTRDGWGDVQQTRDAWHLTAIATDDQGRTRVIDTNPFSDARYAWILDSGGKFAGEQVFTTDTMPQAEALFGVKLG